MPLSLIGLFRKKCKAPLRSPFPLLFKIGRCVCNISFHSLLQRLNARKLLFVSQLFEKAHLDCSAIQPAAVVDNMRLTVDSSFITDGRSGADVRNAGINTSANLCRAGIYSARRNNVQRRKILVDGRNANGPTELIAVNHGKADKKRTAEIIRRLLHTAAFNTDTDPRGADDRISHKDRRHLNRPSAMRAELTCKRLGCPRAVKAEPKIKAANRNGRIAASA